MDNIIVDCFFDSQCIITISASGRTSPPSPGCRWRHPHQGVPGPRCGHCHLFASSKLCVKWRPWWLSLFYKWRRRDTSLRRIFKHTNKNSAVAEMGDGLATMNIGQNVGRGCCGGVGSPLGHHLTQCGLGRSLPLYQVASWSIPSFGHNCRNATLLRVGIPLRTIYYPYLSRQNIYSTRALS